jgi:3-oxoacyl-[acyl-carrier protein] reductase
MNLSDTAKIYQTVPVRYPELKGKVAIVTGSSKGIGKGIALRLAKEGMKVTLNARNADEVEKTAAELRALGAEVIAVPGNVGNSADIQHLIDETMRAFGSIDVLVNNAASLSRVPFFKVKPEMWDDELAVNVKGIWLLSYKAAEIMKAKGKGSIIHISSVGGLRAHHPSMPYDVTKGALDAMTRGMGIELADVGVRVNGIAPGAIYTEARPPLENEGMKTYVKLIPSRRVGFPLEIGAAVAFLASDDADYIIGQTIYVDGGITAQLSPTQYPI